MACAPPKIAETLAGFLLPPACREEVLGDLQERCESRSAYIADALRAVPLVIVSRIRRVTDPQVLLMEAFVLYLSFLGAQKIVAPAQLIEQWGLLRLALPAATALLSLRVIDAYARPGARAPLQGLQEAMLAIGLVFLSQGVLAYGSREFSVPLHTMGWGGGLSVLLLSAVRMFFPPLASRPIGASGPALWLRRTGGPVWVSRTAIAVFVVVALLLAFAIFRSKSS